MDNQSIGFSVFCDGGARGNPGPAASAYVILDDKDNVIYSHGNYLGHTTNNIAEYHAVLNSLLWLETHSYLNESCKEVRYYLDSLLVVNQIKGIYKVKNVDLKKINSEIRFKIEKYKFIKFILEYIPRAKNSLADSLVNETLDHCLEI